MNYKNKHLTEVVCGFEFEKGSNLWDSTYFGQYFEKIKQEGFIEKQERKSVQVQFNHSNFPTPMISSSSGEDDEVIFKNNSKGWAILLGKLRISFHITKDYKNWEDFRDNLIIPFYSKYLELGLGNGSRQCNMIYLNRFRKNSQEKLSDYFTVISEMDSSFGEEPNSAVQRIFNNNTGNLLLARLTAQTTKEGYKDISLECGAICISEERKNSNDWKAQLNETRSPVRGFFEAIITERLRAEM